jgi:hypothetical protein
VVLLLVVLVVVVTVLLLPVGVLLGQVDVVERNGPVDIL